MGRHSPHPRFCLLGRWLYRGAATLGLAPLFDWFRPLPEPLQIASLFGIFVAITISVFVSQRLDLSGLRFLEGYWHPWLQPLRQRFIHNQMQRRNQLIPALAPSRRSRSRTPCRTAAHRISVARMSRYPTARPPPSCSYTRSPACTVQYVHPRPFPWSWFKPLPNPSPLMNS